MTALREVLSAERGYGARTVGVVAVILVLGAGSALAERIRTVFSR
jgi:hypothetical protein